MQGRGTPSAQNIPPEPKRPKPEPKPRPPEAKRRARNGYEYTREQFLRILGEDRGELEWDLVAAREAQAAREALGAGVFPRPYDTDEEDTIKFFVVLYFPSCAESMEFKNKLIHQIYVG